MNRNTNQLWPSAQSQYIQFIFLWNIPNLHNRDSCLATNSFAIFTRSRSSAFSRYICNNIKWFNLCYDIVDLKYVFNGFITLKARSLPAFVAGITRISFIRPTTWSTNSFSYLDLDFVMATVSDNVSVSEELFPTKLVEEILSCARSWWRFNL